jgi:hypothetical protein
MPPVNSNTLTHDFCRLDVWIMLCCAESLFGRDRGPDIGGRWPERPPPSRSPQCSNTGDQYPSRCYGHAGTWCAIYCFKKKMNASAYFLHQGWFGTWSLPIPFSLTKLLNALHAAFSTTPSRNDVSFTTYHTFIILLSIYGRRRVADRLYMLLCTKHLPPYVCGCIQHVIYCCAIYYAYVYTTIIVYNTTCRKHYNTMVYRFIEITQRYIVKNITHRIYIYIYIIDI